MAIQITEEQKYAGRASKVCSDITNIATNAKRFIEDGIAPQTDGQFVNTGLTGWRGFTEEQEKSLKRFIDDWAGETRIAKE